jgi:hypothetical protein
MAPYIHRRWGAQCICRLRACVHTASRTSVETSAWSGIHAPARSGVQAATWSGVEPSSRTAVCSTARAGIQTTSWSGVTGSARSRIARALRCCYSGQHGKRDHESLQKALHSVPHFQDTFGAYLPGTTPDRIMRSMIATHSFAANLRETAVQLMPEAGGT